MHRLTNRGTREARGTGRGGFREFRGLVAVVVAVLMLAGCVETKDEAPPVASVDGAAALELVRGLVAQADGQPRFRVPGTQGHADAAAWLHEAMTVPGWGAPQWQNFTGADYVMLDKGEASGYADGSECTAPEKARLASLTFHNLWAVHDGPHDRLVLLGAHWESKRFASQDADRARTQDPVLGANDGASGVGLLLQLMRHVAQHDLDLPFDLGVVFFDGEDGFEDCHPLAGSIAFVAELEAGFVDRFLLLDMVGDGDARFVVESNSRACDPALADLLQAKGAAGPLAANFPGTRKPVSDDHMPFIEAGIPAVDLIDFGRQGNRTQSLYGFPPYWHTTGDTLDKLDAGMLGHVGDLVLSVLADPAFVEGWPDRCA